MAKCFIIMPITTSPEHSEVYRDPDHFRHVLNHLMIPAVESAGLDAVSPIARGRNNTCRDNQESRDG
jgi:hypothetical protein